VEEVRASEPPGPDCEAFIRRENRRRKALARLVDAGIGVSDVLKKYIQDVLHIQKAYYIPNGADPQLFEESRIEPTALAQLTHRFKVFWTGNASTPWQGIDIILELAKKMLTIDPDILFVLIAGDSRWDFPVLQNLLVLREVPYEAVPHYLASADLCLCLYKPYDWIEYGFYGSSLKLFDYMAAGKPVIASDMGQLAEVIKHDVNGVLVGQDAAGIIERIRELKRDEQKRSLLGARARQDVIDYYNWDRVAQQTEDVLQEVCRS
jgi:glycosyltransferase involved in cell wall biosynthesis